MINKHWPMQQVRSYKKSKNINKNFNVDFIEQNNNVIQAIQK
jgi:hypothetical protein